MALSAQNIKSVQKLQQIGGGANGCIWRVEVIEEDGEKHIFAFKEFHDWRESIEEIVVARYYISFICLIFFSSLDTAYNPIIYTIAFITDRLIPNTTGLLLELMDNNLRYFIQTSSQPIPGVSSIIFDIATAMNELHKNGIIHKDLRSENILALWENNNTQLSVKIADFGLSKVNADLQLQSSAIEFAPLISPERIGSDGTITAPTIYSDIYRFQLEN